MIDSSPLTMVDVCLLMFSGTANAFHSNMHIYYWCHPFPVAGTNRRNTEAQASTTFCKKNFQKTEKLEM